MIRFVRSHPLLSIVASAALVSGGLLVWIASSSGPGSDDKSDDSRGETAATSVADSQEPTTTAIVDPGVEPPDIWPADSSQAESDAARDGVNPAIARLSYSARVDSVASVNSGGRRWVLSELPTETRNRFVDEGLAGPDLDPFGGEILLVEAEAIVKAFPMNEFPPTFLETDGVMVFGGRTGDGGYPDSALVGINALTLDSTQIALRPAISESTAVYGPRWEVGTERQLADLAEGNYLQAVNAMSGTVLEGDIWVVRDDPSNGLCASLADIDYGCDSESLFVGPEDPIHTPRIIARPVPPQGIDHDAIPVLIYGYLPENAVEIEIRLDGEDYGAQASINEVLGMWVVPVAVPNEPFSIAFIDEAGGLVIEWTGDE